MKHGFFSLLLAICLFLIPSCGYFSSQQQNTQSQVPTPPETETNSPSIIEDAQLRTKLQNFKKPEGTYQTTRPLSLNLSPIPEEEEQNVPLPGDNRAGLRTPDLPSTLLYDVDGKLTTSPVQ